MRRFVPLVLVVALVLPAAAWAAVKLPGDGTLVVDNGNGSVIVREARGGILGRFIEGTVTISDLDLTDGKVPAVWNADSRSSLGPGKVQYTGSNLRFRMIGGPFRVQIDAVGIDVSAVGRGVVVLDASGYTDFPGRFSLDGGPFRPLPGHATTYLLGQLPSPPTTK